MKTLKKTLCLILAVVMVVGVLILPAYAADDYTAAITALQNYKVLQGKGDGLIHADDPVTRADMAAIVYRIMTGDTEPAATANQKADAKYGAYADKFKDLTANDQWAKGYIGFCANQGVLKGDEKGNVKPNEQITGYEVQAMLLRALGYDKNNEYTGKDWKFNILADATKTGISKGVSTDPANKTPRGAVAQLTYNATTKTPMVAPAVWPNIGYNSLRKTLIEDTTAAVTTDVFGAYTSTMGFQFNWPDTPVKGSYALVTKPLWETWDSVTECDVAKGLGVYDEHWAITYTNGTTNKNLWNGNTPTGEPMPFQAIDTVNKIGHEGRHFMVYANPVFDSDEDPSKENPDYIFVFVDEFYATVDSIVNAVTDPAGHEIVPASANVTVYSNDYATGTQTTAGSAQVAVLKTSLTGTGYTAGQVLGVHMLTGENNALADSTIVTKAPYAPVVLKTAQVTVKDITMDAANGVLAGAKSVGIVATSGARYFYNYTFGKGTSGSAPMQITGSDIGKEVVLTLDSQGNILNWTYASSATTGYGVTLSASAKQIAIGEWVLNYTVLLPDGSQTTVTVGQATTGAAFADQDAAEGYYTGTVGANKLVYFAPGNTGPYSVFTPGNVQGLTSIDTVKSGRPEGLTDTYTTDPVRGSNTAATAGALVNDKTVFFVANYAPDNTTPGDANDYVFTGYSIYVGEKNIPDMAFTSTDKTTTPGSSGSPATFTHLDVQAFSGTPSGSPAAGDYASYVLVVNATQQSKPKTIPTMDFAYLITKDLFVDMGANTFTYPAIVNGKPGQNLQVKLAGSPLSTEGLYTYADWINGEGYEDVVLMNGIANASYGDLKAPYTGHFDIAKDQYTYANGVLTSFNASTKAHDTNTVYYTVADGCLVYLINPTTGAVSTGSLGLLSVENYAKNCEIWFQLDANGYVSLIYIVDAYGAGNTPSATTGKFSIDDDTVSAVTGSGTTITITGDLKLTGTNSYNNKSVTLTAKIYAYATASATFVEYCDGTVTAASAATATTAGTNKITSVTSALTLNPGTTYKVVITGTCVDAKDTFTLSFTATGA